MFSTKIKTIRAFNRLKCTDCLKKSDKQKTERTQKNKKDRVYKGEKTKIGTPLSRVLFYISTEGNETRERGDQRTGTADVDTEEEGAVIVGETGEEDRARYVADDLAREDAEEKSALFKQERENGTDGFYPRHIAGEDKKRAECK